MHIHSVFASADEFFQLGNYSPHIHAPFTVPLLARSKLKRTAGRQNNPPDKHLVHSRFIWSKIRANTQLATRRASTPQSAYTIIW